MSIKNFEHRSGPIQLEEDELEGNHFSSFFPPSFFLYTASPLFLASCLPRQLSSNSTIPVPSLRPDQTFTKINNKPRLSGLNAFRFFFNLDMFGRGVSLFSLFLSGCFLRSATALGWAFYKYKTTKRWILYTWETWITVLFGTLKLRNGRSGRKNLHSYRCNSIKSGQSSMWGKHILTPELTRLSRPNTYVHHVPCFCR